MKFRVIGGPLTSGVNLEAKHTDTFKSIYKKVQKAVGKKTPIDGYDLFTSTQSGAAGHYTPGAGPLRSTDTPDSVHLDRKQKDPHVLLLVEREEQQGDNYGSMARSLSHSNSASYGAGDAASQDGSAGGGGGGGGTSSASMSPLLTPRVIEGYRRRMQAIFLKYDPEKVNKVDLALERYAGYEEDVIQQLVKKYGPEPAADEVDTSPAAIAKAQAAAAESSTRRDGPSAASSVSKRPNSGASYHDRLVAIYSTYEPEKLSKVDGTLKRYAGREEEVIKQLVKKYGPEPAISAAAPSAVAATAASTPAPTAPAAVPLSPEPRAPHAAAESTSTTVATAAEAPTPTTITMSEAPATPAVELTPMARSTAPADSLPVTPRNLQDDYGTNSASLSPAAPSVSASATAAAPAPAKGPLTYRDRLTAMYATYDPSKIRLVDGTLRKYKGREAAVLKQLVKMYGPEPSHEHVAAAKEAALSAARARKSSGDAAASSASVSAVDASGAAATAAGAAAAAEDAGNAASLSSSAPVVEEPASPSEPAKEGAAAAADEQAASEKEKEQVEEVEEVQPVSAAPQSESAAAPESEDAAQMPVVVEVVASLPMESAAAKAPDSVHAASPSSPPVASVEAEEAENEKSGKDADQAEAETEEQKATTEGEEEEEEEESHGDRYRERLVALYHAYNPSKLHTVEGTLRKFAGKEEAAIQQLVRRYGPEPPALSTEEAFELLKSASGSSPMTSPRSHNASIKAMPVDAADNNSSASANSSKPVSPTQKATSEYDGYRARIHAILAAHDPEKVDKVDLILSRYQGKEEEVIAKLEQRYGVQKGSEEAEATAASPLSFMESPVSSTTGTSGAAAAAAAAAATPARPSTPPPAPVTAEAGPAERAAAAVVPPVLHQAATPPPPPSSSSSAGQSKPKAAGASDDDATRPTAPPSQRSSSVNSSHETSTTTTTTATSTSASSSSSDAGAAEAVQAVAQPPAKAEESRLPAPPAVEHPVVVSMDVVEPARALPPVSAPKHAPATPPPPPVQQKLQLQTPPQQTQQPVVRPKNYAAVAAVAAGHLAITAQKNVLQRYWDSWKRHRVQAKADALVRDELWVATKAPSTGKPCYQLNDTVQPAYTVDDLANVVSTPTAFSSETEIAARALLSALRHCVESRVVEVRSAEEEALASTFLAHWTVAEHLCPVTDSADFARALHQAAHLIAQLDDLMTVIRTQAGQLQQLKNLHKDVLQRMEAAQAGAEDVAQLQAQLESANAHRRELEEELKRVAAHGGVSARARFGAASRSGEARKPSPPTRRVYPTIEERKDAQIAKLQQELAKTRNSLFASKEAEEKMKVQVQQTAAREARRERDERRREGPPGHHSRPVSVAPQNRSHSGPAGQRGRPASGSTSPHRGYPASTTPRGAFSHAIALDTPRRPSESAARVDHNGRAVSSIRPSALDAQDRSNVSVNSSTPWPTSRFVMAEEVERGPCPNCLTPLTSCSADAQGPPSAKAAFCFSCRRSFTFAELRARDARDVIESL